MPINRFFHTIWAACGKSSDCPMICARVVGEKGTRVSFADRLGPFWAWSSVSDSSTTVRPMLDPRSRMQRAMPFGLDAWLVIG